MTAGFSGENCDQPLTTEPMETASAGPTEAVTTAPEATVVETSVADTSVAETTVADTTVAETTAADTTVAETTAADTTVAETTAAGTTAADVTTCPPGKMQGCTYTCDVDNHCISHFMLQQLLVFSSVTSSDYIHNLSVVFSFKKTAKLFCGKYSSVISS